MLQDYIPKQEEVTFEPNETQRSVAVDIIDDAIYEGIETFMVALRAVSPGVAVERSPSWITILDNDDCECCYLYIMLYKSKYSTSI